VVVTCPVTKAENKTRLYPGHVKVSAGTGGLREDSIIMAEQIRAVSKTRLTNQLGKFDKTLMTSIEAVIKITLDLP
jgi:mRNA interferase MazF